MQITPLKDRVIQFGVRLWLKSLRTEVRLPDDFRPGVLGLWHGDLAACTAALRHRGIYAFVSKSKDGDRLTDLATGLGYHVLRGSDTQGALGIRGLLRPLRQGESVAMALDGPRGPAMQVKPGTAWLAHTSDRPAWMLLPRYGASIRLRTWDHAKIPLPFSKITLNIERLTLFDPRL